MKTINAARSNYNIVLTLAHSLKGMRTGRAMATTLDVIAKRSDIGIRYAECAASMPEHKVEALQIMTDIGNINAKISAALESA